MPRLPLQRRATWIDRIFSKVRQCRNRTRSARLHLEFLEDRLAPSAVVLGQQLGAPNTNQFHADSSRSGFYQNETVLTPTNVSSGFGQVWESPVLDGHLYASPLFADSITVAGNGNAANHSGDGIQNSSFQNKTLGLVFAATGGGTVYAIAGQDTDGTTGIAPGTIVWKTHLGNSYGGIDGNSIGVLSTPIIDLKAGRIYVTASVTDYLSSPGNPNHGGNNWEVFALNLADGSLVSGWPLIYTQSLLDSLNQNKLAGSNVAVAFSSSGADQRGALALSPDGSTLYVDFACYGASNGGWMTAVATGVTNGVANGQTAAIVSAYSAIDTTAVVANGGMWGAGGPVVDANGNVFVSTGDSPGGTGNPLGTWGNSVLEWGPSQTLTLTGAYTPWNYTTQDTIDSDLGGGSPILINLPAGSSTTTELLATGGKQGNAYLLDAGNNLNNPTARPGSPASYPADLTKRPPSTVTPSQDPSLYDTNPATGTRTYYSPNQVGPLSLFGPYNESSASGNTAKARDTPAEFIGPDGNTYVVWAGTSKSGVGSSTPVAPSLYLTKVVATPGQPAYLQVVTQNTQVMSNPGANIITGNGTSNEIDWVLDTGVQRTDSLTSFSPGAPVLYAYNALTMQLLWSSAYEELDVGGKYNTITDARGNIFVGTDRIQAFGLTGNTVVDDSTVGTGANQFNYVGTGWQHITGSSTMGTYQGTVSTDNVSGDYATLNFSGAQIKVYVNERSGYGSATFSIDGSNTQTVALTPANSSPNGMGSGDVLVYNPSGLGAGPHTLKILDASGTIAVDRVEIVPTPTTSAKIGVSLTDGGIIPQAGGTIPYTINYQNAGSIVNSTGVNATGVTLSETVPAYSTFDAANSTPGWILASGNGSAGSTYTFNVGNLNAGVTGSVVFSIDLSSTIPTGVNSVTNTVSMTDSASDTASNNRTTPIPPPTETTLVFQQQPPANGGAGVPLSPPVIVAAKDQFGNTFTADSSSTVTLTINGGTFYGGGTTATATMSSGLATFSNLIVAAAGTYTLTATDGALTSATSARFSVSANSKLAFVQQPTQTVAGTAISPSVQVAIEDQGNHVVTTDTSTVTLTIDHGSFANGSTTATAMAVNGVATFNSLAINATGSYTLFASDGILSQTQSNSFSVVAVATRLVFTQQPNNGFVGEAVNPSVVVALEDGFGNLAAGDTSNVTLTLNGGTLFDGSNSLTVAAVNGLATFNNIVPAATGTYTLTATDPEFSSAANSFSFTFGTHALTIVDDNNSNNVSPVPTVAYSGGWAQSPTSLPNNFDGTVTSDSTGGDSATVTFNGTLVTVYAVESPTAGSAAIFIDGNSPTQVNLFNPTTKIAPIFTSSLLAAGSHTIQVEVVSGSVSVDRFVIGPATPGLSWATPADITYGTPLDGTELDAFTPSLIPGTFNYSPGPGTLLAVGQAVPLHVTYTPNDTANYGSASDTVFINVDKSTPVITWPTPPDLTYGQPLGSAQLNATANVPGTFVYNPALGTVVPTQDNYPISVTFTPNDTTDYNTVTVDNDVDILPATPIITWPNPADVTDGTALSSTQLNATASVPGTFTYNPPLGTILAPGQHQALGVTFTPTDTTDYSTVGTTAYINVNYGPAAKLVFTTQPTATSSGSVIFPAVTVAVEDAAGYTLPGNASMVTLTLSTGTFVGGSNTVSVQAVNGVATFNSLAIANNGTYTVTATDGSLTQATSNQFNIGASAFDGFNNGSTDFSNEFNLFVFNYSNRMSWNSTVGVADQNNGTAGGGIAVASGTSDETAIYTPTSFNLADQNVHTVSVFLTAAGGLNSGDRNQIGFLVGASGVGFNGGYSFISARIYGNDSIQIQTGNGSGTSAQTLNDLTTPSAGSISTGDWLQLVLTTQETSSGSFSGSMSLLDYGQTGTAAPKLVVAPVAYAVSGLTSIGTGSNVHAAFRTATGGEFTTPLDFDNFAVDLTPAKMAYLSQPSSGIAGQPLGSFVAAVEDNYGNVIVGDTSTVTLSLTHDTFSNGQSSVSGTAVDGIATFTNLVIPVPGSYIVRATDANPNLDPGYGPIVIATVPAVTTQPTSEAVNPGDTATFMAAASGSPLPSTQWQVSTNNGSSFSNINGATSPTLSLSNVTSGQNGYEYRAVFTNPAGSVTSNAAILNVSSPPSVISQPSNASVNTGGTATFTAIAAGFPQPTVQWQVSSNGGAAFTPIGGATSTSLTLSNVSLAQQGYEYEAVFSNATGTATSNPATLTVRALPIITWPNPVDIADNSALTAVQLDATASVPGTFVYSPPLGSLLPLGQHQALNVVFTPTDTINYGTVSATTFINVNYSPAAALAFLQQPANGIKGAPISPAVTIAVKDAEGNTLSGDSSTVTLTISSNTFVGGSTTVSAVAINGVATFANLAVAAAGTFTLSASDGSLTPVLSSTFFVAPSGYVNFNNGATDLTPQFSLNSMGTSGGTNFTWGAGNGVGDNTGGAAGGGVLSTTSTDQTAIYTPAIFNLSDGKTHTMSEFATAAAGLSGTVNSTGDRSLQIGFITSSTAGFNNGFSFLSARLYGGDNSIEFAWGNGSGTSVVASGRTAPTGAINPGDWLKLNFTARETSSGNFALTAWLQDYGSSGVSTPVLVTAPISFNLSGLTAVGTGAAVYAGFHSALIDTPTTPLEFDNFAVDQPGSIPTATTLINNGAATVTTDQPIGLTITVAGGVPNGDSVTLFDASNGNARVPATGGTITNGATTLSVAALALGIGTHNLFAVYAPEGDFAGSQSSTSAITVNALNNSLSYSAGNGIHNLYLQGSGGNVVILDNGSQVASNPAGSTSTAIINGAGSNSLTVDYGSLPAGFTVDFASSIGNNSLTLKNGNFTSETYSFSGAAGNMASQGSITFGGNTVNYSNVYALVDSVSSPHTVTLQNGNFSSEVYTYTGPGSGYVKLDGITFSFSSASSIIDSNHSASLAMNLPASAVAALQDNGSTTDGSSQISSGSGSFTTTSFITPTTSFAASTSGGSSQVVLGVMDPSFSVGNLTLNGVAGDQFQFNSTAAFGNWSPAGGITLNGAALAFNTTTGGNFAAAIAGSGSVLDNAVGTLTLMAPTSYSGATIVGSGSGLQAGAANILSANSDFTINNGAFLTLNGFGQILGSLAGAGTVQDQSAASATLTVGGDNASTTFGGILQDGTGAGHLSLIKNGAGTFALSGATNSYGGATTINAGVLSAAVLVNGGIVSSIGNSSNASANLVLAGGTLQYSGPSSSTDRSFTMTAPATISISSSAAALSVSGTPVGAYTFTKAGSGGLTFTTSGALNNVTGIAINGGQLQTTAQSLSSTNEMTISGGATFLSNGTLTIVPPPYPPQTIIGGTGTVKFNSLTSSLAAPDITYGTALGGNWPATIATSVDLGNQMRYVQYYSNENSFTYYGGDIIFSGPIVGGTSSGLTFNGYGYGGTPGVATLSGSNGAFLGSVVLAQGEIVLNSSSALSSANSLTMSPASGQSAFVYLNGNAIAIGSLSTAGAAGTSTISNGSTNGASLTISQSSSATYNGVIEDSPNDVGTIAAGQLSLIMSASSTAALTLSGANTYTGATTVSGGTLLVNGSVPSSIAVNSAGKLGGSGSVGSTSVSGTLAPGGTAQLTVGQLSFNQGNFNVVINNPTPGSGYDQVIDTGANNVSLAGAPILNLTVNYTPAPGTQFTIVKNQGNASVTGTFNAPGGNALTEGSVFSANGHSFSITYHGGTSGHDVVLTAVNSTGTSVSTLPSASVTLGTSVSFRATITGNPSVGTVTFYAGPGLTNPIGSPVNVSNGSATSASTSTLPLGTSTVTAVYSGGTGFIGSQGTAQVVVSTPITIGSINIDAGTAPILSASESGNVVTIVTDGPHGFSAGDPVVIANVGGGYNGSYTIASVAANSFTINFGSTTGLSTVLSNGVAVDSARSGGLLVNGATAATSQRSMVDSIVYKFNQAVVLGTGAFSLSATGANPGTVPSVSYSSPDGGITWVVTFSGSGVVGNSIANGEYQIVLNSVAVAPVLGAGTLAGSDSEQFYRLYGDTTGSGHQAVGSLDRNAFNGSFGTTSTNNSFLAYLDANGDGRISAPDRNAFNGDFGLVYSGFSSTI